MLFQFQPRMQGVRKQMKRAAAIIGPTPAFVRWAIKMPCRLRDIDVERLPDSTFRQLRAIKELDLAHREDRVFQEVAFHSRTCRGQELVGFLPAEVLEASGGRDEINNACSTCVANTQAGDNGWVGCFGIAKVEQQALVDAFEQAVSKSKKLSEFSESFSSTQPKWFGVWMESVLSGDQCETLHDIFGTLELDPDWREFRIALECCAKNELELHVEYFPPGVSDGQIWRWVESCDRCRFELEQEYRECPCCGRAVVMQSQKRRKVLGLRPYMKLKYVLGEQESERLIDDYLNWKSNLES